MKKVVTIIIIILTLALLTFIIDYNRIKNGNLPMFTIKLESENKINYYGLGYKIERFLGTSKENNLYEDNKVKFGLWIYTWQIELKEKELENDFEIKTNIENNCNDMKFVYYITDEGNRIHTICLSQIEIRFPDKTLDLDKALQRQKITMQEIIENMKLKEIKDDNTKIYIDELEISNQGLQIFECENKNYYIVPKTLEYKDEYC